MQHEPIGNYAWMTFIRRSDLPDKTKLVAMILATYADPDGSNACVGQERLADEAMCDERYARDSLRILEVHGLIEVTRRGRRGGDADTYQLTTPGVLCPPVPMRRDPKGLRVDADGLPFDGKRPKALSVRPYLSALTGTAVPVREMPDIDRTGTPVPPEESPDPAGTGTPVPEEPVDNAAAGGVENPEYRHPSAATEADRAAPYRHWEPPVPALGASGTGTPVPPTKLYQLLPTDSPQVTASPAVKITTGANKIEMDGEWETARTILADLPPPERDHWRHRARTELEAAGAPLTHRAVDIRAADLATGGPPAAAVDPLIAELEAEDAAFAAAMRQLVDDGIPAPTRDQIQARVDANAAARTDTTGT